MAKKNTNQVAIQSGMDDEDVRDFLLMLQRNSYIHNMHEGIWRTIQELFESEFTVYSPSGKDQISSKLLLQVLWKVTNKLKIPDFKIYKAGPFQLHTDPQMMNQESKTRDWCEQIVTDAVGTVLKEGRFIECMRDKGGAFYKMALFGDTHVQVGYDQDGSDYPIAFRVGSLSDTYINTNATDIRDATGGLSADSVIQIYRYTKKQFDELWPEFKDKVVCGEIPRNYRYRKQLEKTWFQTVYDMEDIIEVGFCTSITKVQCVIAGPACVILEKLKGEPKDNKGKKEKIVSEDSKYFPYIMDGKPYLPLLHFKFFPSSAGYYNEGIGHILFDIAVLLAKMDNMAYNHAGDNIWPITFVNSPNKNTSKLFNEIMKAQEMRDNGGRGYVVSENPQGSGSGVTVESFQSQPITQEWERCYERLEKQITRLGFQLDAPDLGANPNEMSIMAEQESTDAPIKQIIEFNASEFEMAVKITMDFIKKFIPDDDMTPLNSTTDIDTGNMKIPMRAIPLGWVAKELRENKYFVIVNSRDGTVPSGVLSRAQITQSMTNLPPGSPAWNKLSIELAKINGQNISMEDLAVPQAAPPAPMTNPQAAGQPIQTETSPVSAPDLKFNK